MENVSSGRTANEKHLRNVGVRNHQVKRFNFSSTEIKDHSLQRQFFEKLYAGERLNFNNRQILLYTVQKDSISFIAYQIQEPDSKITLRRLVFDDDTLKLKLKVKLSKTPRCTRCDGLFRIDFKAVFDTLDPDLRVVVEPDEN